MAHEINNLTGNIHYVGPYGFPTGLNYREELPEAVIENLKTATNIFYQEVDEIPPPPTPIPVQGAPSSETPVDLDEMPIDRINALKATQAIEEVETSKDTEFLQIVSVHATYKTVQAAAAKRLSELAKAAEEIEQGTSTEQEGEEGSNATKESDQQ